MEMTGLRLLFLLAVVIGLMGAGAAAADETFRDCADCPAMVRIRAGAFMMGSTEAETARENMDAMLASDERPAHVVKVRREFSLARFAVTRGEFAAFVAETGYRPHDGCNVHHGEQWVYDKQRSWRDPGFEQTDQHPVVCVDYEATQRYVQWLSRKTGRTYRLPSEAEWEYSARAGTTTARFWGDGREDTCRFANVSDFDWAEALKWDKARKDKVFQCSDRFANTAPVGSFRPNAFGLYDMLGNVWQWNEDCFQTTYRDAPKDGSAWKSGDCRFRVAHGGSWFSTPYVVRAAHRCALELDSRYYHVGFRVARSLAP
jgi:formylglycine-generating enzyme required for sulfatase activity